MAPVYCGCTPIHGHIFVDNDNQHYVYYARVGLTDDPSKGELATHFHGKIHAAALKEDLSDLAGEPVLCLMADKQCAESKTHRSHAVEGACVFTREGRYYMTYSAGPRRRLLEPSGWSYPLAGTTNSDNGEGVFRQESDSGILRL